MPPKSSPSEHPELFRSALVNLIDRRHPLVRLAGLIDWDRFATTFGSLYRDGVGRPGLPTRLMVGLHLLKHMDGLSDDAACPTSTSTCRSFATISSGVCAFFLAIPATPSAAAGLHYRRTASRGSGQLPEAAPAVLYACPSVPAGMRTLSVGQATAHA